MIQNSARRKPSAVFNSSSGTTIREAVNVQHFSIFSICEDGQHFSQHSYNVTINSHNGQMTLHTNSHASGSGAVWQEGRTILGAKSKLLYREIAVSETVQNRTCTYTPFCFRITYTMTSQNIDLSSWGTLYSRLKVEFCNFLMIMVYVTNWQWHNLVLPLAQL
jgi:hypothetical protein